MAFVKKLLSKAMDIFTRNQISHLYTMMCALALARACPEECACGYLNSSAFQCYTTDCSQQLLFYVPWGIPNHTNILNLSNNEITAIPPYTIEYLYQMQVLDVRGNRDLRQLPLVTALLNTTAIYTDSGATCCRYEVALEDTAGVEARRQANKLCKPTVPIDECVRSILDVFDFIVLGLVLIVAPPLNIWVFTVTIGTKARLQDPVTFTTTQYSISNFLLIIYAAVIFIAGSAYHNIYPQYIEEWLGNPGCSFAGFALITSTLASSFFHMLDGITLFLKLHYPFDPSRHMTLRRLGVYIVISWLAAILLAAVPFFSGDHYNQVYLCLPFYAGDYDFSYKFVILYTCVCGVATIIEITMVIWLVRSVIKTRSDEGKSPMLNQENKRFQSSVTSMIIFKSIFSIVTVILLGLSCAGGELGQIGRHYFATLSVLESVANPILVVLRKKKFRRDTLKLLKKCHCCKNTDSFTIESHDRELSRSTVGHSKHRKCSQVEPEPQLMHKNKSQLLTIHELDPTKVDKATSTRKPSAGWM